MFSTPSCRWESFPEKLRRAAIPSRTVSLHPKAGIAGVHSGKDCVDSPPADIYWTDKNLWNNSGERVSLSDAIGRLASESRY